MHNDNDEDIYLFVLRETNSNIVKESLWAKAYALSEGIENKIKPIYIRLRVDYLKHMLDQRNITYSDITKTSIDETLIKKLIFNKTCDDTWIKRLWEWADINNISDLKWEKDTQYIDGGYWTGIPRDKQILIELTSLNLNRNDLERLPIELENLINLKVFSCRNNSLVEIPAFIYDLPHLQIIDFRSNKLVKIEEKLGNLTQLRVINFSSNLLSELPKSIGNILNLEKLFLGSNKLTTIPSSIGNLKELIVLKADSNNITILPEEITNLVNLKLYSLYNNPQYTTPSNYKKWINLLTKQNCQLELLDLPGF